MRGDFKKKSRIILKDASVLNLNHARQIFTEMKRILISVIVKKDQTILTTIELLDKIQLQVQDINLHPDQGIDPAQIPDLNEGLDPKSALVNIDQDDQGLEEEIDLEIDLEISLEVDLEIGLEVEKNQDHL